MARVYLLVALTNVRAERLPLAYTLDWKNPVDWLAGEIPVDEDVVTGKRDLLKAQPENAAAWVSIGNWYIQQGKNDLGRIFYLRALDANKKSASAIANLAYLEGRADNWQAALAGYRAALEQDEFALQPKKNLARLYMASGLWRHANLALRQLEVRAPTDAEVKTNLGLSYLAAGKVSQAETLLSTFVAGNQVNARFAKAILSMGKGDISDARKQMAAISRNEMTDLVLKYWNP
jgi:tetratricopeptide (TPR) repeat protein